MFGDQKTRILNVDWRWIPSPKVFVDSSISHFKSYANNLNRDRQVLFESDFRQEGIRQDASFQVTSRNRIEGGYLARRIEQDGTRRRFNFTTAQFRTTDTFDASAWHLAATFTTP